MKKFAVFLLMWSCWGCLPACGKDAEPALGDLLKDALFAEEADRDLVKAEDGYREILRRFDRERSHAATATLRLGIVLLARGEKAEAEKLFARVLREFGDHEAIVAVAKKHLGEKAVVKNRESPPGRLEQILAESPDLLTSTIKGVTPLGRAAKAGEADVVDYLLEKGAKADGEKPAYRYAYGKGKVLVSPLGRAVEGGHLAVVDRLTKAGATLDDGLLHTAAEAGNLAVAKRLLEAGMDVNLRFQSEAILKGEPGQSWVKRGDSTVDLPGGANHRLEWKMTALEIAVYRGFVELARLFLEAGASATGHEGEPSVALYYAMENTEDLELMKLLLEHGAEVNGQWSKAVRNARGLTPLQLASRSGHREIVQRLLAAGAGVEATDTAGATALHLCTSETVDLLIAAGGDVNAAIDNGSTPLHFLWKEGGAASKARALLAAGADPSRATEEGHTPLILAINQNNAELVDVLIKGGADVSAASDSGVPIGLAAAYYGNPRIIKSLLDAGADRDQTDAKGRTPLELAISAASADGVATLIEAGADPIAGKADGKSPITFLPSGKKEDRVNRNPRPSWIAEERKRFAETARVLVDGGADPNAEDAAGETVLHKAARRGDEELVDYLLAKGASVTAGKEPAYLATTESGSLRGKLFIAAQRDGEAEPDVISVVDSQSGRVLTTVGAFADDGEDLPDCPYTFMEAYGFVAGMDAKLGSARIWRIGEDKPLAVNLREIIDKRDAKLDVPLRWGDMVQFTGENSLEDLDSEGSAFVRKHLKRTVKLEWEDVGEKAQENRIVYFSPNFSSNDRGKTWRTSKRTGSFMIRDNVVGKGALLSVRELGWESGGRNYLPQTWVIKRRDENGVERTMEVLSAGSERQLDVWPKDGDTIIFRGARTGTARTSNRQPGHVIIRGAPPKPASPSSTRPRTRRVPVPPSQIK